jgi:ribosomal protein S27E
LNNLFKFKDVFILYCGCGAPAPEIEYIHSRLNNGWALFRCTRCGKTIHVDLDELIKLDSFVIPFRHLKRGKNSLLDLFNKQIKKCNNCKIIYVNTDNRACFFCGKILKLVRLGNFG